MVTSYILLPVFFQAILATTQQLSFQTLTEPRRSSTILDEEFESWLRDAGEKWGMNGVSIAVTRRVRDENGEWAGWETELKGYGVADRWGTPVDEESLFSIGSNTKLFTALGLGLLVQDDAYSLQWNTKVKDILHDEWVLQDPVAEKYATLMDILSHQSGLPAHDLSYSTSDTLKTLVSKLRYLRPSAELRQAYQYNNQKIIRPLGLGNTTYDAVAAIKSGKLADGFLPVGIEDNDSKVRQGIVFKPVPYFDPLGGHSIIDPAGGIISNVKDLARWLQTLLLLGRHPDTNVTIIPSVAIAKSTEGASIVPSLENPDLSPVVYGFGQGKYSYQGHVIIEHSGGTIGHISSISRAPYDNIGIAILTNTQTLLSELIKWKLYAKALGLKEIVLDSKYQGARYMTNSSWRNPPEDKGAPPTLSIPELSGVYFNPAYGSATLCDFKYPVGERCSAIVTKLESVLIGIHPDLVASWDKIWSSHIVFTHRNHDHFDLHAIKVFPPPFPGPLHFPENNPFAFDFSGVNASARFLYTRTSGGEFRVDGIAVTGLWGASDGLMKLDGEDEKTAEVWFNRVY